MMATRLHKPTMLAKRVALYAVCMALTWFSARHVAVTQDEYLDDTGFPSISNISENSPSRSVEFPNPLGNNGMVETASAVSESFLRETQRGSATIPKRVWTGLRQAGWRLQVAEFVVDAFPSLKGVQPRNWPKGMTWENTDALNMPKLRLLVLAEKRITRAGKIIANSRVGGALRHEVGHAFDKAAATEFPYCSGHPDFLMAYHRDRSLIGEADRAKLKYYFTRDKAGRQEAFAEAFALVLGGGSDRQHQAVFRRCFPQVIQYVRGKIDGYRPKKEGDQRSEVRGQEAEVSH